MHSTVRTATLQLMRDLGLTTVFGNPGSTELAFLSDWPQDFRYILGLQEQAVVGMADGYAQATGRPAFVNLHSAAGVGHALGSVFTAFKNQTPLVITAGQQARALLALQPFLGAERATEFPRPYVKWSAEPARAEDVPLAIAQAYEIAIQPPCGPTFISIPSDDWARPARPVTHHAGGRRLAPDPQCIAELADTLNQARNPAIIYGPGVGREGAQHLATRLVEHIQVDVWAAPMISRDGVAQDHPQFQGFLPAAAGPLAKLLAPYDCVLVLGGPAFLLHVADDLEALAQLPRLFQITNDARSAAASPAASSIIASLSLALPALIDRLTKRAAAETKRRSINPATDTFSADRAIEIIANRSPEDAIFVEEAPSHKSVIQRRLRIGRQQNFYAMASGGLGFGLAAAAGVALGQPERRVIALIGDGSAMYSIQSVWTAVREGLAVTYVILNNQGYGAMRAFSQMLQIRNIPGIDVQGIDFVGMARALGCPASLAQDGGTLEQVLAASLAAPGPWLIEVNVGRETAALF